MKDITFESSDGKGTRGVLAEPSGTGKAPGVVLIQEWWGVNAHIKDLVTRLANDGFLVVAPDLYDGKTTKDAGEAAQMMNALDTLVAVKQIAGAVSFLKAHARSNGKVGVTGFCMGGALSFASACHVEGLAAIVPFYGVPPAEKVDYAKVKAPIQTHVASKDQWVTPAKAEAIKKQLDARNQPMEICVYDADHAFVNDTRPEVYSPDNAKLAWGRMTKFMHDHLG
jgi:carboxymethylenebutenolidase